MTDRFDDLVAEAETAPVDDWDFVPRFSVFSGTGPAATSLLRNDTYLDLPDPARAMYRPHRPPAGGVRGQARDLLAVQAAGGIGWGGWSQLGFLGQVTAAEAAVEPGRARWALRRVWRRGKVVGPLFRPPSPELSWRSPGGQVTVNSCFMPRVNCGSPVGGTPLSAA
jgi:hypothetical protein